VSVAGQLPRLILFEAQIDDDERERRDPLSSFGLKQALEVSVHKNERRQFLGDEIAGEFAHEFDALPVQLVRKGDGWRTCPARFYEDSYHKGCYAKFEATVPRGPRLN
jgi:hypothetical protein